MSGLEVWPLPSLWFFLLNPRWIDSHWFHIKSFLIQQLHTHGSFLTWTIGKVFPTALPGSRISLFFSVFCCFCSVTQSCATLCDPHELKHTRFPVLHHLPGLDQTHVHWLGDVIQLSHPLLSPSSPAFNLSQHQGLFRLVSPSHQVGKVLEFQLQHQSFQWILRIDLL